MSQYVFNDWTAVTKMRNEINPNLRADVQIVRYEQEGIAGYILKVFDRENDNEVLYSFGIDLGLPHTFSLTSEEAIDMMNLIGFRCVWEGTPVLPPHVIEILTNIHELGYTIVTRCINPAKIIVEREHTYGSNHYDPRKVVPLSSITKINYHDFVAIPANQRLLIQGLIGG